MKILHLTLKKKWFDKTDSGEKREEYREITPYWVKRLLDCYYPKEMPDDLKGWADDICFDIGNGHEPNYVVQTYYCKYKAFDQVFARNGYNPKKNPSWLKKCEGISIGYGQEKWGAEPGKKYFVIKLGERIQ